MWLFGGKAVRAVLLMLPFDYPRGLASFKLIVGPCYSQLWIGDCLQEVHTAG